MDLVVQFDDGTSPGSDLNASFSTHVIPGPDGKSLSTR